MKEQEFQHEKIERIVWMYWDQGFDRAPSLVKACYDSWVRQNPGWRVIFLDCATVNEYLSGDTGWLNLKGLCLAHKSDLLRLYLLKEYGGAWVDATTFCMRPLDEWIPEFIE